MRKALFLFSALIILLPGCFKRSLRISKTAIADIAVIPHGFSQPSSFAIMADDPDDLQTKELSNKIAFLLQHQGYNINDIDMADYCLYFNYGMDSERRTFNVARYVPGPYVTNTQKVIEEDGSVKQLQQLIQASGTTVYTPEERTYFTKYLDVSVYDAYEWNTQQKQKSKKRSYPQIWHSNVSTTDESPDLRWGLDYLAVDALSTLGKNTFGIEVHDMYHDNADVQALRRGYFVT